jgi:WD40 repeat protein
VAAELAGPLANAHFDPRGERVLGIGAAAGVVLLDARSLADPLALAGPHEGFTTARFSSDGAAVVASKSGASPAVFDARGGRRVFEITTGGGAFDAQFVETNEGRRILVAGVDGILHVVDAVGGAETGPTLKLPSPPSSIYPCAGAARAVVIARQGEDGAAFLLDLDRGTWVALGPAHGRLPTAAAFSPNGRRVAITSYDSSVRTWDASTGKLLRSFLGPRRQYDVAWSADGERLITRPDGASAQIWYSRVRPDLFELEGHAGAVNTVAFAPDGRSALTAAEDGTARVWNVDPGAGVKFCEESARFVHQGPVRSAAFDDAGSVVLTVGADNAACTFDPRDGRPLREFARHPSGVLAAALDPKGERFVTLCGDGRARLWLARSSSAPLVLPMEFVLGKAAAFSPDGRLVALSDTRDAIGLFDAADGHLVRTIELATSLPRIGGVDTLAFRPLHDEIAAGCADGRLRWFRVSDGEPTLPKSYVFTFARVSFSRDGRLALLSGAWGRGSVRSLSPESGTHEYPRSSHLDDITSACYSEDAALVLTTSKDGSARGWLTKDGSPFVRREGFDVAITSGALSSGIGLERAIIGCADGRVCVWPIDPLPAARARRMPPLNPGTQKRESELAAPLEYP